MPVPAAEQWLAPVLGYEQERDITASERQPA